MKHSKLLLIVVILACFTTLQAQNKIGIRAGFQSSAFTVDGKKADSTGYYKSFYVGAFKEHKIIPFLHLGYGLEFMQTGVKYKSNDEKITLNNLSIPVYLKGKVGPVFAVGGFDGNIKISEKYSDAKPEDAKDFKTFTVPAFLGVGVKILMFSIEGRYHWGLTEINDKTKFQYLQVGAAVSF